MHWYAFATLSMPRACIGTPWSSSSWIDVPIVKRAERIVGVRVLYEETTLQSAVRASDATWDKPAKLWRMPYRVALGLGLRDRIVET